MRPGRTSRANRSITRGQNASERYRRIELALAGWSCFMRRALRLLLTFLSASTLLLGITSYYVRGNWGMDRIVRHKGVAFGFYEGTFDLRFRFDIWKRKVNVAALRQRWMTDNRDYANYSGNTFLFGRFHFRLFTPHQPGLFLAPLGTKVVMPIEVSAICWLPFWSWSVLFAAYPLFALNSNRLRRLYRRLKGRCGNCNYNLTGNVSGVCPECGMKLRPPVKSEADAQTLIEDDAAQDEDSST